MGRPYVDDPEPGHACLAKAAQTARSAHRHPSNMGDNVLANIEREFDWLPRFDVLVWSYQLRMAKPDPAIYRYVLKELGTRPEETLFLDDKLVNIEAAQALGMKALKFTTVERLCDDLIAHGLSTELPLPV
jgi:putative hydrolase of the HAD superfamily